MKPLVDSVQFFNSAILAKYSSQFQTPWHWLSADSTLHKKF